MNHFRTVRRFIGAAFICISGCSSEPSSVRRDRPVAPGPGAVELLAQSDLAWQQIDRTDMRIHVPRGSHAATVAEQLADSAEAARKAALAILDEDERADEPKLELFFVDSREVMQKLAGRPIGGFAQPGELTAAFVAGPGYRPFLRHEIMHAYSFVRWGDLRASEWLSEGLAALAQGACQQHEVDALAAGYLAAGSIPAIADLARDFRAVPELPGYMAGASLAKFIRDAEGVPALRDLWQGKREGTDVHPLGTNGIATERDWHAHLRRIAPAQLDTVRLRQQGC